jgi:hypothetical protein
LGIAEVSDLYEEIRCEIEVFEKRMVALGDDLTSSPLLEIKPLIRLLTIVWFSYPPFIPAPPPIFHHDHREFPFGQLFPGFAPNSYLVFSFARL